MPALLALALAAAICCCVQTASAQESAKDSIEPRLTRTQFAAFTRTFGLDGEQRSIAELMFSDYNFTLDELATRLDEEALAAGSREVMEALAGRGRLSQAELQSKRVAVLNVYHQAWLTADVALEHFISGIEHVLTNAQAVQFPAALRELHRVLLLHPRQADRDYQEYAGDGVDVLVLAESAMTDGGELHPIDPASLQAVLMAYETQLDALLLETASDARRTRAMRKIATIQKDAVAQRDLDQAALTRWKRLYELNQNAVRQIAQIAESNLDASARQRWMDRFDQASFSWLYPRRKPDRQIEWMRTQSLTAETMQRAEAAYENYLSRRRDLSRGAIDIMLRARLEFQTMLYSMMDPSSIDDRLRRGLYEELLKNSGEQATLESTTSSALEGLLNATQRDAMRKAMLGPDRRGKS